MDLEVSYLDSYIAYIHWDGSNMKEEDLSVSIQDG